MRVLSPESFTFDCYIFAINMKSKFSIACILIICSVFSKNLLLASTQLPKVISANEIWTVDKSPYVLTENTAILNGANVTVMPGVEIRGGAGPSAGLTLQIHGGFACLGKADSMIAISNVTLQYNTSAVDFNPKTGKGNQLIYTSFSFGAFTGSYAIQTSGCDLKLDYCLIDNFVYGVYGMGSSDSLKLYVSNSKFKSKSGIYPVLISSFNSYLNFTNNSVENCAYLYMAYRNVIKNNYISAYTSSSGYGLYFQSNTGTADVECNYLKGFYYAVYAASLSLPLRKFNFINNLFDSCNYVSYLTCQSHRQDSIYFYHNNFTRNKKTFNFQGCTGSSSSPVASYSLTDNYWGTTDTTEIINTFYDNRSIPSLLVKIQIGNALPNPVATCWPTQPLALSGVENLADQKPHFGLYPNPALQTTLFVASKSDDYRIQILDLTGKKIKQINFAGDKTTLDLTGIKAGTYLVNVTNKSGNSHTEKIQLF